MFNPIKWFRKIPEEKKIIFYGRLSLIKGLFYFLFKILVGIVFRSYFLIAIAIYSMFIGYVKHNCAHGLKHNKENIKDIHAYIRGGAILAISSIFYIAYTIAQMFFPSNFKYNLIIAIAIAAFAFYSIIMSFIGVVKAKGKTMLIKEYKYTNFATAFNNITLAQIAILSFTTSQNMSFYNGAIGVIVGLVIFGIGIYLLVDGLVKKHRYYKIIAKYPKILEYINE